MLKARFSGPFRRRGFGLIEMTVSIVLLATMVLITLQVIAWMATERKAVSRREAATRLVGVVMERALAHAWAELSTEALAPLVQSMTTERPAAGSLRVEVTPAPFAGVEGRNQKQVMVEVTWPPRSGVAEAPVRLVAWTFERRGTQP